MRYWRIALGGMNEWERQNYTIEVGGVCLKRVQGAQESGI